MEKHYLNTWIFHYWAKLTNECDTWQGNGVHLLRGVEDL